MAPSAQPPLYMLPISARPPRTLFQIIHFTVASILFFTACVMIHTVQLIFVLPLRLVPSRRAQALYDQGVRYTKGSFGKLLTLMCQFFAPTKLRITFETEGLGAFTKEQIEDIVIRDSSDNIAELRLPPKMVIVANHQIYVDWWYVWCLTYFMNMHQNVFIVLKKSLKYIPVFGWGMQIYRFIFLARSWASDKHYLVSRLAKIGRKAQVEDTPFVFIIYPEGTVISDDTRPKSKKYADKLGIPDMTYTLLPRSTGLHYSLRALAPRIPDLKLLDLTVVYPGIPPGADGQLYYTIRSIFLDGIPPPMVHLHLRLIDIASAVPIGDLSGTDPLATPPSDPRRQDAINGHASPKPSKATIEADPSEKEHLAFDEWLRALWRLKDEKLGEYHRTGETFDSKGEVKETLQDDSNKYFTSGAPAAVVLLKLRDPVDILDAFCFFVPAALGWAWHKVKG